MLDNSAFASYVLGGSNGVLQFGQCSLQLDASPCISHEPRGHVSDITSAQFFPSGAKVVLTTSLDTTLRLWNFDTGSNPRTLQGHTRAVTSAALIPPHGANVISSSLDESIRTWDLSIGNEIDRVNVGAPASQVLLHPSNPDLAFVALRSEHGAVVVVDRVLGQITQRLEDTKAPINSIALANDGSALLAGDHSGVCTLWDVSSLGKLFMRCQWTRTDAPVLCVSPTDEPLAWLVAGADGLPYRVNVKDSGMVELSEELGCATAEEAETTSVVSLKGDVVGVAGGKGVVFYR